MDADRQQCQDARVCKQAALCARERGCYLVAAVAAYDVRAIERAVAQAPKPIRQEALWDEAA